MERCMLVSTNPKGKISLCSLQSSHNYINYSTCNLQFPNGVRWYDWRTKIPQLIISCCTEMNIHCKNTKITSSSIKWVGEELERNLQTEEQMGIIKPNCYILSVCKVIYHCRCLFVEQDVYLLLVSFFMEASKTKQ